MSKTIGGAGSAPGRRASLSVGVAGLLAGFVGFGLGELAYECFSPENVSQPLGGAQVMRPTLATIARAASQNSALTFGVMGGIMGVAMGLAGGLASGPVASPLKGCLIGLILGSSLGAALPLVLIEPYHRLQAERNSDDLLLPISLHASLWGPLGAVAGLAYGVGRGRRGETLRALLGGLFGAVLGAIAYDVLGALVAPLAGTSDALSTTWPTRLMARLLVPLAAAAGIALLAPAAAPPAQQVIAAGPEPAPDGGM
jgi:hypothetical protein